MGLTTVTTEVESQYQPKKTIKEDFLVDGGASFTVLPKKIVEKLDLKPAFEQEFILADGTKIKRPIGSAMIKFNGRKTASPVVLGRAKDSPVLGVLTLEALGLVLDPFERKLQPARLLL